MSWGRGTVSAPTFGHSRIIMKPTRFPTWFLVTVNCKPSMSTLLSFLSQRDYSRR